MATDSTAAPLAACASLGIGLVILYISIFTLTFSHWALPYFRLALAPIAIVSFWNFGYGNYEGPFRTSPSAFATVSLYGMMRILEHSVVTFCDANQPMWVTRRAQSSKESRTIIQVPNTLSARCVYALDLLTSMRGSSWFVGIEWSWKSRTLPVQTRNSRSAFVLSNISSLLVQYLLCDFCDILIHARQWNPNLPHPLTELPILQQIIFSISICAETYFSVSMTYMFVSTVFVLCGSDPSTWPPMFDSPFSSKSLSEFWSRRWHFMFRRVFERISLPLMQLLQVILCGRIRPNGRAANIFRMFLTFVLSTLLHLIIMYRISSLEFKHLRRTEPPLFFDGLIMGFFLSQPLGLMLESVIVVPFADWMFPARVEDYIQESKNHRTNGIPNNWTTRDSVKHTGVVRAHPQSRDALTTLFTWVFIIWTGRWWCDAWARAGFLSEGMTVPISPLRGLWEGRWIM